MATFPLQAPGLASLQKNLDSTKSNTGPAPAVSTATGTGKTTATTTKPATPTNVGTSPQAGTVQKTATQSPSASPEGSLRYYLDQNGGDRNAALKSMIDYRNKKSAGTGTASATGNNLKDADPNLEEGTYEWYKSRGIDDNLARQLTDEYKLKMSNTTHWSEDPSVTGTEDFANQINDMLNEQEAKGMKVDRQSYIDMYNIPKQHQSTVLGQTNADKKNGTSVKQNVNPLSSNSTNAVVGKNANSVVGKAVTLESRLADAKARYGENDPRVQKIQKLLDIKNSRAKNTTDSNKIKTPTSDDLERKVSDVEAKGQVNEMEVDDRNKNLQNDRIDTAKDKTGDLLTTQDETNDATEKNTQAYKDEFSKEYESYKKQLEERESKLKADEEAYRTQMAEWKSNAEAALANEQAGQQAEVTSKLGKLGASDTVMANAQNEIRNNAGYQKQRADLQKSYIDGIQSNIKEYQTMYNNLIKDKTDMTDSKRALAEQLTAKINENKEKINEIKKSGISEMFKPVETFQDARLEDSNNAELSSKQNSEAQYRWAKMDEQARIAKLKDALYNYDSSISRSTLTAADYEAAAKEGDITKAVAKLANTAKNYTKPTTTATGSGNKKTTTSSTTQGSDKVSQLVDTLNAKGYTKPEQVQTALTQSNLSADAQKQVLDAWNAKYGWRAPLVAGRTMAEQNADIDAYKKAHNLK